MKVHAKTAFASLVLFLVFTSGLAWAGGQQGVHWSYHGDHGPNQWAQLSPDYELCKSGKSQSPIDISAPSRSNLDLLSFHYKDTPLNILNNGHTVQDTYGLGSFIKLDGEYYDLLQFHFHGPSEHTVNGKPTPMEVHLVHKNTQGGLAVVSVMMTTGKEHVAIEKIWSSIPAKVWGKVNNEKVSVNGTELLPESRSYYHYPGSLTTPPCSEGVRWYVMQVPIEVSKDQIVKFKSVIGFNARPVQELNGRKVQENN